MTEPWPGPGGSALGPPLAPRVFAILLILAQGSRHGYGLMQELRLGTSGERWVVGPATLYRTLKQLEQKRWIQGREGPAGLSGGPPRREYSLTELGRRVAGAEAARMARLVGMAEAGQLLDVFRSPERA
jgi:DNA-binding PadR family transcriptional regulator